MISIIAQERLLGAALGMVFTGIFVLKEHKNIFGSIADTHRQNNPTELRKHVYGRASGSDFAHVWNKAVDKTLGPVIESLSSRGW
ncbi:hypothetical protein H6P81_011715 [Aristolochia fimbriata]|uniref:Uncharacterized protein n=1 Tax=Aristolochia fimbriata TaxID=158543 RepID=A0AAV7EDK4_ARIFI|nr:hypothetical protein H6P81_011715 [Aristolochia fimbriata]